MVELLFRNSKGFCGVTDEWLPVAIRSLHLYAHADSRAPMQPKKGKADSKRLKGWVPRYLGQWVHHRRGAGNVVRGDIVVDTLLASYKHFATTIASIIKKQSISMFFVARAQIFFVALTRAFPQQQD